MFRETIILLSILLMLQPSDALRCWRCNTRSKSDTNCGDTFSNYSIPSISCEQTTPYDLRPIENCVKIKYKVGEEMIYERGCDRGQKYPNAEYFQCNTDLCNAADNHRSQLLHTALFTSFAFLAIKLLRF